MQTSVGTRVINSGEHRYVIPTVSLSAPLPDGGSIVVRGCPLAHDQKGVCEAALTTTGERPRSRSRRGGTDEIGA